MLRTNNNIIVKGYKLITKYVLLSSLFRPNSGGRDFITDNTHYLVILLYMSTIPSKLPTTLLPIAHISIIWHPSTTVHEQVSINTSTTLKLTKV